MYFKCLSCKKKCGEYKNPAWNNDGEVNCTACFMRNNRELYNAYNGTEELSEPWMKTCPGCYKQFKTKTKRQVSCSRECSKHA